MPPKMAVSILWEGLGVWSFATCWRLLEVALGMLTHVVPVTVMRRVAPGIAPTKNLPVCLKLPPSYQEGTLRKEAGINGFTSG